MDAHPALAPTVYLPVQTEAAKCHGRLRTLQIRARDASYKLEGTEGALTLGEMIEIGRLKTGLGDCRRAAAKIVATETPIAALAFLDGSRANKDQQQSEVARPSRCQLLFINPPPSMRPPDR